MSMPNAFAGSYDYLIIHIIAFSHASQEVGW